MHQQHHDRTAGQPPRAPRQPRRATPTGFTLVEILVVIAIIGILAALLIPAVTNSIKRARVTSIKLEVNSLASAIDQYNLKYGDYPPDFSSEPVIDRHYRKLFPRISANELGLLKAMTGTGTGFNAAAIDRAEALVFALSGYSDNIQRPFTGPGGPFAWVAANTYDDPDGNGTVDASDDVSRRNPSNFQVNGDRINKLFDFDAGRLTIGDVNPGALSTTNKYLSSDGDTDLFPTYLSRENGAPYVYFDSRTYAFEDTTTSALGMNGFAGPGSNSFVRPYLSSTAKKNTSTSNFVSMTEAMNSWEFINPDTYQIISAGLDDSFGGVNQAQHPGESVNRPVYYQYPSGVAIVPRTDVAVASSLVLPGGSKYQEGSLISSAENFAPDNITNFSNATVVDDLP